MNDGSSEIVFRECQLKDVAQALLIQANTGGETPVFETMAGRWTSSRLFGVVGLLKGVPIGFLLVERRTALTVMLVNWLSDREPYDIRPDLLIKFKKMMAGQAKDMLVTVNEKEIDRLNYLKGLGWKAIDVISADQFDGEDDYYLMRYEMGELHGWLT